MKTNFRTIGIFKHVIFSLIFNILYSQLSYSQGNQRQMLRLQSEQEPVFIENNGQVTDQYGHIRNDVKYIYSAPGFKVVFKENSISYEVFASESEQTKLLTCNAGNMLPAFTTEMDKGCIKFKARTHRIDVELIGAKTPQILAGEKIAGHNSYLSFGGQKIIGNVYSYRKLTYKNVWPKIDLVFYAKSGNKLKYDIVLHPGADIRNINFGYEGAGRISLTSGKLVIGTAIGDITETIPVSYLNENKEKVKITYQSDGKFISFSGRYDKRKTLVIDPELSWSTYYGGDEGDGGSSVATDAKGNVFMSGGTSSKSSIATSGAHISTHVYGQYGFLVKFNPSGTRQWGTYLQNGSGYLATDAAGNVYLSNGDFNNLILRKFTTDGAFIRSTYLKVNGSGWDNSSSITVDINGDIYVAGTVMNTTTTIGTANAHQPKHSGGDYFDAFLIKFDSLGNRKWGTYYGGGANDYGLSATTDISGNVYMTGYTRSAQKIASPSAFRTSSSGMNEAFLVKFDSSGARQWATYFGGSDEDYGYAVAVDGIGNVYMAGNTSSKNNIATTGAFQKALSGKEDVFLVKFDSTGSRQWSTYFGGTEIDKCISMPIDKYGHVYLAGITDSETGITSNGTYQDSLYSKYYYDLFLTKFDNNGIKRWATYYGGSDHDYLQAAVIDSFGNLYMAGFTNSKTGISTSGAHQTSYGGNSVDDALLVKFRPSLDVSPVEAIVNNSNYCGKFNDTVKVKVLNNGELHLSSLEVYYTINNSKVDSLKRIVRLDPYQTSSYISIDTATFLPGSNVIKVWTNKPDGESDDNIFNDTLVYKFIVNHNAEAGFYADGTACASAPVMFENTSTIVNDSFKSFKWSFSDGGSSNIKDPVHQFKSPGKYKIQLISTSHKGCSDTAEDSIIVLPQVEAAFHASDICVADSLYLIDSSVAAVRWLWDFGDSTSSVKQQPVHKFIHPGNYSIKLKVESINGCIDSMVMQITVWPVPKAIFSVNDICLNDSLRLTDSSKGATSWFWDFGDGYTATLQNPAHKYSKSGKYTVHLRAGNFNGCTDSASYSIVVDSSCVWPGDANADRIVDNKDILAIGLAYSDTGSYRADTSTVWKGHIVKDWSNSFSSGANYKHADSDGDGIVSNTDTLAIARNYTRTHSKKHNKNRGKNTDPVLKVDIQNDSLKAGDTLVAYIELGENALLAKDVYGLAFSLNYNNDYFSDVDVDFTGNWFGTNTIGYSNSTNGLDLALTKTDHKNTTGAGKIASVSFIIKKDKEIDLDQLKLEIVNNILISFNEQMIPVYVEDDSVKIYKEPNSIFNMYATGKAKINVYPNPFTHDVMLEYTLDKVSDVTITLSDITGKSIILYNKSECYPGRNLFNLSSGFFNKSGGIYFIKIEGDGIITLQKIVKIE